LARKLKSDRILFTATLLLVCLSVVMVYSASAPVALQRYGQASFFVIRQVMWAALGLPMLWFLMKVDYRTYREPVFIWCCLGLATLALVAVLFSAPVNSARRWFGMAGIGVQPSEFAKLAAIIFIAAILERRMHRIDEVTYSLLPIVRNTVTGIRGVDPNVREAGVAMGFTPRQLLWHVELPLAMPTIVAGIRIATVVGIGLATIAAAIGGGGLGTLIFRGVAMVDNRLILAGALPAAALALLADVVLTVVERRLTRSMRDER